MAALKLVSRLELDLTCRLVGIIGKSSWFEIITEGDEEDVKDEEDDWGFLLLFILLRVALLIPDEIFKLP